MMVPRAYRWQVFREALGGALRRAGADSEGGLAAVAASGVGDGLLGALSGAVADGAPRPVHGVKEIISQRVCGIMAGYHNGATPTCCATTPWWARPRGGPPARLWRASRRSRASRTRPVARASTGCRRRCWSFPGTRSAGRPRRWCASTWTRARTRSTGSRSPGSGPACVGVVR